MGFSHPVNNCTSQRSLPHAWNQGWDENVIRSQSGDSLSLYVTAWALPSVCVCSFFFPFLAQNSSNYVSYWARGINYICSTLCNPLYHMLFGCPFLITSQCPTYYSNIGVPINKSDHIYTLPIRTCLRPHESDRDYALKEFILCNKTVSLFDKGWQMAMPQSNVSCGTTQVLALGLHVFYAITPKVFASLCSSRWR